MDNKEFRAQQFKKTLKNNEEYIKPSYYETENGISFHDLVVSKFDKYQRIDINEFQVEKYLFRWREKNGLEDLVKCRYYLDDMIQLVKEVLEEENNEE